MSKVFVRKCLASDSCTSLSLQRKELNSTLNQVLFCLLFCLTVTFLSLHLYFNTCTFDTLVMFPHFEQDPPVSFPVLDLCGLSQIVASGESFMRGQIHFFFFSSFIEIGKERMRKIKRRRVCQRTRRKVRKR